MTLYSVVNPYPVILNQTGTGLNGGKVYIGTAGMDPEVNPVTVYWDAAGLIPAAQPLTTIGGYIWNAGSPAQVYGPTEYSIRIRDRNNQQVFYEASVSGPLGDFIGDLASTAANKGGGLVGFDQESSYAPSTVGFAIQNLNRAGRSIFEWLSPAQIGQATSGVQPSLDMTAAINTAIADMEGGRLVFPPGCGFRINGQLNVLSALVMDFSDNLATLYLGTQNQNGIVIGDGTDATRSKLFNGRLIRPSIVPVEGVPAFASGSAVFRNYVGNFHIEGLSVYGRDSVGWKLLDGLRDERATESDAPDLLIQFVNGSGVYTKGDGTTPGRTVDCNYDNARVFGALYPFFIDDGCAGIQIDNPILYSIRTGGAIMRIRMTAGPNGQNIFVRNIDAECTPGATYGVWVEGGDNVNLVGGWIGGQAGVPAILFDTLSSSCSTSVNVDVGEVVLKGSQGRILPCDITGDNTTAGANGVIIQANDCSIASGTTIRQYLGNGISFGGTTPARLNVGSVQFNNNGTDIAPLTGFTTTTAPVIADGTTDKPIIITAAASITAPMNRGFVQFSGAAPVTTIAAHGAGKILTIQASGGTVTLASGGNLILRSPPVAIPNGQVISLRCDGVSWFEVGRSF